jgi:hypothetical protein
MNDQPFNPLDKRNLGISVAKAMLEQPVIPLDKLEKFPGAGVYAIYYVGDCSCYAPLARMNREGRFSAPIYIGKAIPPGGRKGGMLKETNTPALFNRLMDHRASIEAAENLDLQDFHCRHLVVDDIWIPLGETLLITWAAPVWNNIVDGFGNHDPGKGRHAGLRSRWDVLHPGRHWAERCQGRKETSDDIARDVAAWLTTNPVLKTPTDI